MAQRLLLSSILLACGLSFGCAANSATNACGQGPQPGTYYYVDGGGQPIYIAQGSEPAPTQSPGQTTNKPGSPGQHPGRPHGQSKPKPGRPHGQPPGQSKPKPEHPGKPEHPSKPEHSSKPEKPGSNNPGPKPGNDPGPKPGNNIPGPKPSKGK